MNKHGWVRLWTEGKVPLYTTKITKSSHFQYFTSQYRSIFSTELVVQMEAGRVI